MNFNLISPFKPMGDQVQAIAALSQGLKEGLDCQLLLGGTGTGKTFTIANVIEQAQRPALILSHNKTLAAQLYAEFKAFFPHNSIHYFVSYYDYYQPEAFMPVSNTYIEKELLINQEIEKLRLATTSALMSSRKDIIVISSVSCIFGMGNPDDFNKAILELKIGQSISKKALLLHLVDILYHRSVGELTSGSFKVFGDTVDIFPPYLDYAFRIIFFGNQIEEMMHIDIEKAQCIEKVDVLKIFPANLFVTSKDEIHQISYKIQDEMMVRKKELLKDHKPVEAKRLEERVIYDIEMMKELGYCSGIENYSRFFDGRKPGSRPFCLLDYFPKDYILVIDESHVTVPQVRGMYGGDRSRKLTLVEHGFRLPAALDNRPLNFTEFEAMAPQSIYVSATPGDYEMEKTEGVFVDQVIRPTGVLDPIIEIRPIKTQVDDLIKTLHEIIEKKEKALVTTLTIRLSEELSKYLNSVGINARYLHSKIKTLDRIKILQDLKQGVYDVLIGVNLLREGLDLPQVSFVGILDADKEGFLRSERSLIQTIGRAARNVNGKVIMYADHITNSMNMAIKETQRRRKKQEAYNRINHITPQSVSFNQQSNSLLSQNTKQAKTFKEDSKDLASPDPIIASWNKKQLKKAIMNAKKSMQTAVKKEDYLSASKYRDEMYALEKLYDKKK